MLPVRFRHIFTALLTVILSMTGGTSLFAAGSVFLQLSDSKPGVGDQVYLKIICDNVKGTPSTPSSVPGFDILFFTLSSSSSQMYDDGKTSYVMSRNIYAVTLRAEKEGKYTFGPITVGGVKSNTISYTIGPK